MRRDSRVAAGELYKSPSRIKAVKACKNNALTGVPEGKTVPGVDKVYKLNEKALREVIKNSKLEIGMPHAELRGRKRQFADVAACRQSRKPWGYSTMKRYLLLALSAVVLALLVAPDALAVRIRIADPFPVPPNGYVCDASSVPRSNQPCNIFTLGDPAYQVTFLPCSSPGIPSQTPPPAFSYCLWMNNVTGSSVNEFTFEFTVPDGGSLDETDVLTCDAVAPDVPGFSSTNTCHGTASAGHTLKVSFFTDPALLNGSNFWLYTDFRQMPDPASVTVSVSVPEPGELGVFGLGLLMLGYGWQRRRRESAVRQRV